MYNTLVQYDKIDTKILDILSHNIVQITISSSCIFVGNCLEQIEVSKVSPIKIHILSYLE